MNIFDVWPFIGAAAAGATAEEKRSDVKSKALGHSVIIILIITAPENNQNNYSWPCRIDTSNSGYLHIWTESRRLSPLFISRFHHL